ncbi:MAG: carbamoyl-phosphate synthase large subunit [Limnochordia bacterium]|nr:carbamoyl-phosphate synthase large subunit [Limnochordia bacterium]
MPKRTDLRKIMIIGSGPIVIGQACEFDYSGSQACKALKEEGYKVVLVNSNPATIMTDPVMADRTYVEPLIESVLVKIIERERPDALLPTLGGQTALNLAVFLAKSGVLEKYNVEVIGASPEAIARAEDRDLFRQAMTEIGVNVPKSGIATSVDQALDIAEEIGYPLILRPAFTLGGSGGGVVYNVEELKELAATAISTSPMGQVLVEQSVLGWKEVEFEVVKDSADNVVIVTSMENIDPMGVHTGDSIVVAPAQTLSVKEYNRLIGICHRVIRKIGLEAGGANIQLGVNPDNGEIVIIEVNPRVSRSSALASKATGYPIAWVASKLAIGYTLDEIKNEVTGNTSSFHEPAIDYCVVKMPRFTFEKFPEAERMLTTSMKSVGETMSIGRNFQEALQKGLRGLEVGRAGFGADGKELDVVNGKILEERIRIPSDLRLFYVREGLRRGMSVDEIYAISKIDRWFLDNMQEIVEMEQVLQRWSKLTDVPDEVLRQAKEMGFSDLQLAKTYGTDELDVRNYRKMKGIESVYKLVDTCAGQYEATKPYFYSTYGFEDESRATEHKKVIILGGGPNRIGQGIEFDYCCVHASYALKEEGLESVMINSNPETVSTDFDTSDRLYFEPLTREDVLDIIDREKPTGVIVQFGGQTPLNLANPLQEAGVAILGTSPDSIDRAEDRERFNALLEKLQLQKPPNGMATSFVEAKEIACGIGYPVLVRPSYVLGGRAMQIVHDEHELANYIKNAVEVCPDHPVLIDKFLEDAIEIDVDAIADGETVVIGGIMEHIEEAGIHSGDSACVLPCISLAEELIEEIKETTKALALELDVKGLMNIQYAVRNDILYVLEVNPRASRTIPFVSKATGVPLAKLATKVMIGKTLKELGFTEEVHISHVVVKEAVFPFNRFPGVDALLSPEMKSTGEVMGIDTSFGMAFAKSQLAAGQKLPQKGKVFISVKNQDKRHAVMLAGRLIDMGFRLIATKGTASVLRQHDIEVEEVHKIHEGRPHVLDLIKNGEVGMIINTTSGKLPRVDERRMRALAVARGIPLITTLQGAQASVQGIEALRKRELRVKTLQEYHEMKTW